jgi:RNA polymerase sigma-70 factor, ECF subfamily
MSDDGGELLRRLASGDPQALGEVIEAYGERVRRLIGQLTAWSPDVDDLFQETMIRVWRKAPQFRHESTVETWLVSIAFRVCFDHRRGVSRYWKHLTRFWERSQNENSNNGHPRISQVDCHDWDKIQLGMQHLSNTDRELLVMVHIEGWALDELANHLNIKTDTLHVKLHRARTRLKRLIET